MLTIATMVLVIGSIGGGLISMLILAFRQNQKRSEEDAKEDIN
jgi:hypothetical protein